MDNIEDDLVKQEADHAEALRNSLLFGDQKLDTLEHIYSRYAMGDPVSVIAADLKKSESDIHRMMRTRPEKYEETKLAREAFIGLRLQRSVSLVDAHNLRLMEDITEGRVVPTADQMKDITRWIKSVADRLALHEGKPTASYKFDTTETFEELEAWVNKTRAAGHGIPLDE